ncbi:MAG: hypothetical protein NVS2B3_18120 [Vulcanimicrobiaceae bacterium]
MRTDASENPDGAPGANADEGDAGSETWIGQARLPRPPRGRENQLGEEVNDSDAWVARAELPHPPPPRQEQEQQQQQQRE